MPAKWIRWAAALLAEATCYEISEVAMSAKVAKVAKVANCFCWPSRNFLR